MLLKSRYFLHHFVNKWGLYFVQLLPPFVVSSYSWLVLGSNSCRETKCRKNFAEQLLLSQRLLKWLIPFKGIFLSAQGILYPPSWFHFISLIHFYSHLPWLIVIISKLIPLYGTSQGWCEGWQRRNWVCDLEFPRLMRSYRCDESQLIELFRKMSDDDWRQRNWKDDEDDGAKQMNCKWLSE